MSSCPAHFMCVYGSEYTWDVCVPTNACTARLLTDVHAGACTCASALCLREHVGPSSPFLGLPTVPSLDPSMEGTLRGYPYDSPASFHAEASLVTFHLRDPEHGPQPLSASAYNGDDGNL